jgi:hypothetical protein
MYRSFVLIKDLLVGLGGDTASFSQNIRNLENHRGDQLHGFDDFRVNMQIIRQNLISGNFFLAHSPGIALRQELPDHFLGLIFISSIAAQFGKILLHFEEIAEVECIKTNLNNNSVVDRLSVIIAIYDILRDVCHD